MTKIRAAITGIGGYVPEYILDNHELSRMVDTSDEWIMQRIGIRERRIMKEKGKATAYMGSKAVKELLKKDGIFIASIPNKKSLYRKFERLVFLLISKPLYLKFAKNDFTLTEFISSVTDRGFVCLGFDYFAIKGPLFMLLEKFLPPQYTKNMLICIFRKI